MKITANGEYELQNVKRSLHLLYLKHCFLYRFVLKVLTNPGVYLIHSAIPKDLYQSILIARNVVQEKWYAADCYFYEKLGAYVVQNNNIQFVFLISVGLEKPYK